MSLISTIYQLETYYEQYFDMKSQYSGVPIPGKTAVIGMLNFLRSQKYFDKQWQIATGHEIDNYFISYLKTLNADSLNLFNRILPFIQDGERILHDGEAGIIDLAHLAATMEAYFQEGYAPAFWSGWGGDLATGMANTTDRYNESKEPTSRY